MAEFDKKKFAWRYMKMVLLIYTFIHATRDGLWEFHLSSLDALWKYFAHDKQTYARLVPLYLAEMAPLQVIHQEFMDGNFAINKN